MLYRCWLRSWMPTCWVIWNSLSPVTACDLMIYVKPYKHLLYTSTSMLPKWLHSPPAGSCDALVAQCAIEDVSSAAPGKWMMDQLISTLYVSTLSLLIFETSIIVDSGQVYSTNAFIPNSCPPNLKCQVLEELWKMHGLTCKNLGTSRISFRTVNCIVLQ